MIQSTKRKLSTLFSKRRKTTDGAGGRIHGSPEDRSETDVATGYQRQPASRAKFVPELPYEIWAQIIDILPNLGARLYPLLLVNTTFYHEVARIIYRTIYLNGNGERHVMHWITLLRTLAQQSRRALLVERFSANWIILDSSCIAEAHEEYWKALTGALCAMGNLQSLSIGQPEGVGAVLNTESLLRGCTFRLTKLVLSQVVRMDIRRLKPYTMDLREFSISGRNNYGFNTSLFPQLKRLSLEDWNQPGLLSDLKRAEVKALWWGHRYSISITGIGDPYLALRALSVPIYRVRDIEDVCQSFPSLRYLSLMFCCSEPESPNILLESLKRLQHLKFIDMEDCPPKWQASTDREKLPQNILDAISSPECVRVDFEELWRVQRRSPTSGEWWDDEKWWN